MYALKKLQILYFHLCFQLIGQVNSTCVFILGIYDDNREHGVGRHARLCLQKNRTLIFTFLRLLGLLDMSPRLIDNSSMMCCFLRV